ncbi:MAG: amidohydrolase family protein [Planctomycetes bacterium]|nr:amidohydrolase family protein [Planctomycetota bacterium]
MKRGRSRFAFLLLAVLAALAPAGRAAPGEDSAGPSLLVLNARVPDPASDRRVSVDFAVRQGRFEWVEPGDSRKGRLLPPASFDRVLDLHDALVLPGFNDAHLHFSEGGASLDALTLNGLTSLEAVLARVRAEVEKTPPGAWVLGAGWDHTLWPGQAWPTRADLDRIAPQNPVALERVDGHVVWVNTQALDRSGITSGTQDPPGGEIARDAGTRAPTGILKERASELLKIEEGGRSAQQEQVALECAFAEARRFGVTSVQDGSGRIDVYDALRKAGKLTARVTVWGKLGGDLTAYKELRAKYPANDPWLRFGGLKGFVDGTLGSGTAALLEPYSDRPASTGVLRTPWEALRDQVCAADKEGFQVLLHAIGDRAVRLGLDAFEAARKANGARDSRHRLEHAQLLDPADMQRLHVLGAVASMQPCHFLTDMRWAEDRVGAERMRVGGYAWRAIEDSGAALAFGTDWPVEPLDPLRGLYAATTRQDESGKPAGGREPNFRLPLARAVRAYTRGSAYAEFQEAVKGELRQGQVADFVVLDRDVFAGPTEDLLKAKVEMTFVGGRQVFPAPPSAGAGKDEQGWLRRATRTLVDCVGIAGNEGEVRRELAAWLPLGGGTAARTDAQGNLVLEVGHGTRTWLVAAPLDTPGWLVSGESGAYLRLARPGRPAEPSGPLEAGLEGRRVRLGGMADGLPAVVVARSFHFGARPDASFGLDQAFVDPGWHDLREAPLAPPLLAPVTPAPEWTTLAGGRAAAFGIGRRALCAALVWAARMAAPPEGLRFVFAWTGLDDYHQQGLFRLAVAYRPELLLALDAFPGRPGGGSILRGGEVFETAAEKGWLAAVGDAPRVEYGVPHGVDDLGRFLKCHLAGIAVKDRGRPTEVADLGDAEALAGALVRLVGGDLQSGGNDGNDRGEGAGGSAPGGGR